MSIMLYGCETWSLSKIEKRTKEFKTQCYRKILKSQPDKVNKEVYEGIKAKEEFETKLKNKSEKINWTSIQTPKSFENCNTSISYYGRKRIAREEQDYNILY